MATRSANERDDAAPQQSTLTDELRTHQSPARISYIYSHLEQLVSVYETGEFFLRGDSLSESNCSGQTITLAYELTSQKLLVV